MQNYCKAVFKPQAMISSLYHSSVLYKDSKFSYLILYTCFVTDPAHHWLISMNHIPE